MGLDKALQKAILPASVLVIAVLAALGGDRLRLAFRYERTAIEAGEFYRLVSGHFVHLGWSHLVLNAAGLGLAWFLVGPVFSATQWLFVIATTLVIIDAGFWLILPGLSWYVGLSGLLHGILAAGAVGSWRKIESRLILVVLVAKLAYESLVGVLPGTTGATGGDVVTEAHLYGFLGGVISSIIVSVGNRRRAPI